MRNLKKISAVFLVVAMLLSLVTINVFADTNNVLSVKFKAADKTTVVTSQKGGKVVYADICVTPGEYDAIQIKFTSGAAAAINKKTDITLGEFPGAAATVVGNLLTLAFGEPGEKVVVTDETTPLATIKMTLPSTEGNKNIVDFTDKCNYTKLSVNSKPITFETISDGMIDILPTFTGTKAIPSEAAVEVGVGADIASVLKSKNITATVTNGKTAGETDYKAETGYAITNWTDTSATKYDINDPKAGTYTFTGTVTGDSENKAAQFETLPTEAVTVTVGQIDLSSTAENKGFTIADVEPLVYQKTEAKDGETHSVTADAIKEAANNTENKKKTTTITNSNDKIAKETANIVWDVKEGASLNTDVLTTTDESNKVVLEGVVSTTEPTNYKNSAKITMTVTVVPAEITGSKFSVDNAAQYGNAKVTFTIPGAEVNGKKVSAYMYTKLTTDGKIDESSLVANSKVETEEITAEVSSEEGATPVTYKDYTGSLQFASFDSLGLKTNDKFYVVLKVDTATVKNGEDMYVESYVLPESNRRPGSSGGNSGGTVVVKKHDVKVTEGTNGTATVDKEAKVGDTVKVDVKPNEGYKVKEIIVKTADGKTVEVDQKNRTFVMPDGDVTVEVVYEEGTEEPTVADGKFTDVPDTFWAAADIYTLKEAGIINGKSDKEFDPEGKVTRAEFTKMIVNLFGVKASQNTVAFTDCKADDWFTPFVAAAVEAGYVKGITDTEFAPDKTITREEACTILGRAYAKTSDKALNFTDASEISDFATAYVALLVDMGYVNGYEDGTFLPKNEITRAEAAKIIASAFRAAEKAKTEVKADDKTDAKADAKTDAKADNGETPEK